MTDTRFRSVRVLYVLMWVVGLVVLLIIVTAWLLESFGRDTGRSLPLRAPTAVTAIAELEGPCARCIRPS